MGFIFQAALENNMGILICQSVPLQFWTEF